jgi:hypothetical protein
MNKVTLTGADDRTDISAMIDLSAEFPFAEWGILVSAKQEGSSRFPSRNWIERFCHRAAVPAVAVSMHVCGSWVRAMLRGQLDWNALPEVRIVADRVQVNTHAEEHISNVAFLDWIGERNRKQFIIQLDAVNDHILDAAFARKLNVAGLFDGSHGAGVLPADWLSPRYKDVYYGYAGGLGPENVVEQVGKIAKAAAWHKPGFWIDMEGRVRTHEEFDLAKVRRVLELCAPLVG